MSSSLGACSINLIHLEVERNMVFPLSSCHAIHTFKMLTKIFFKVLENIKMKKSLSDCSLFTCEIDFPLGIMYLHSFKCSWLTL